MDKSAVKKQQRPECPHCWSRPSPLRPPNPPSATPKPTTPPSPNSPTPPASTHHPPPAPPRISFTYAICPGLRTKPSRLFTSRITPLFDAFQVRNSRFPFPAPANYLPPTPPQNKKPPSPGTSGTERLLSDANTLATDSTTDQDSPSRYSPHFAGLEARNRSTDFLTDAAR